MSLHLNGDGSIEFEQLLEFPDVDLDALDR
jgi:hypothetical protein